VNHRGKGPYLEQMGVPMNRVAPCPFCGSKDLSREFYSIHCNRCGADGPELDRKKDTGDMIEAWNSRWMPPIPEVTDR